MAGNQKLGLVGYWWFLFVSRFLFRLCEVASNHVVRILDDGTLAAEPFSSQLLSLNSDRRQLQRVLRRIGASHDNVCADCKGKCCGGVRERDTYIDRILQDPATPNRYARRLTGELVALTEEQIALYADAEWVCGHCRELTTKGCRIPCDLRPIQCAAYFCGPSVQELSRKECRMANGINYALMRVQLRTVGLAFKARFGVARRAANEA